MQREEIVKLCNRAVLRNAAPLFGTQQAALQQFPAYEGAANLVYEYDRDGTPLILRLTYSPERPRDQIRAELHFVEYLSQRGVRVSRPVRSRRGNLIETLHAEGIDFHAVSFIKGKGMRLPDNGYRYRSDAPIEEYFRNWGRTLGQMHRATQAYRPLSQALRRPAWAELHRGRLAVVARLPDRLHRVAAQIRATLAQIEALPREPAAYGLIHGDFNDGNFTVDYTNGNITVFDFDDACTFYFIYELAAAWEGGLGRTMFRGLEERKAFMDRYMAEVMAGYETENKLSAEWLARLPLFVRLLQIEEFLHYAQYLDDPDPEIQAGLRYKIRCIEDEIPFMGFFDPIYSPQSPFAL